MGHLAYLCPQEKGDVEHSSSNDSNSEREEGSISSQDSNESPEQEEGSVGHVGHLSLKDEDSNNSESKLEDDQNVGDGPIDEEGSNSNEESSQVSSPEQGEGEVERLEYSARNQEKYQDSRSLSANDGSDDQGSAGGAAACYDDYSSWDHDIGGDDQDYSDLDFLDWLS